LIPTKTQFTAHLIRENGMDKGHLMWLLCPGMSFRAPAKWWGDWGVRDQPHVGVDLCLYQDGQGNIRRLDEDTRIPAMYDGVVAHTCDDFLGRSIMMEHRLPGRGVLYSMYGHTVPRLGIRVGQGVCEGEIVARLADATRSKTGVLPHLHISLGWAPCVVAPDRLDWETIAGTLTLLDPLRAMDGPAQVVEPASVCRELVQAFKDGPAYLPKLAGGHDGG